MTGRQKSNVGFLICIEGLDASGKTTQARLLTDFLRSRGYKVLHTTEPTTSPIGRLIKERVLRGAVRPPPVVEALLFAADRLQHVRDVIKPALNRGYIVISDRYVYSSLAYQGAAGLSLDWIRGINRFAPKPDLAIYLDVDPETAMKRIKRERTLMENLEVQRGVRSIYLKLVESGELVLVDGERNVEEVFKDVKALTLKLMGGS